MLTTLQAQTSAHGGGNGYPTLSLNGDIDQFSLCKTSYGQDNIVYKPSSSSTEYDFSTCHPVTIEMVGTF